MAKKLKLKTKAKNNTKIKRRKNILSISKDSSKTRELQLTDIQKKIIDYVNQNKSILNYYKDEKGIVELNKKIIEKVKDSCLCCISDSFGAAVCISENGYILTCSHAAPPFDDDKSKESLYIFPNGEIVKAITLEKDERLDLALLKIIGTYEQGKYFDIKSDKKFKYSKIKSTSNGENEKIRKKVFCIGNPAFMMYDDDGKLDKNNYKPFWISFGKIKGYMKDEIFCNNDLGPLIHNCWTYWGHSGAPIFNLNGEIVGLHNSWNENNANRHGNSLLGIAKFIEKFSFLMP